MFLPMFTAVEKRATLLVTVPSREKEEVVAAVASTVERKGKLCSAILLDIELIGTQTLESRLHES